MKNKLTMLVVDDVEVNRALLKETFYSEYEVMEACDGGEAMEILHKHKIDIVILDLCMPGLNGEGVLRRMKSESTLKTIPVIVKTAIDEEPEVKVLEMGADDFVFSPCNPAIIKNRVNNIVQKYVLEHSMIKKRLEEEKHLSRVREEFIADMSHELRNPLNGILGIVNRSFSFANDPEQVCEALRRIKDQVEYMQSLADDILDMAAIDHERMTIHTSVFQLNEVVAAISGEFYTRCRERGIAFKFNVNDVMHESLIGDAMRMKQIWNNLLSNAYKYTAPGGTICTSFSQKMCGEDRIELEIVVEDNGCGITEDSLKSIWIPYERDAETKQKAYSGSGLGLAITKGIVELMGGSIYVQSTEGKGSIFTIKLPFMLGEEEVIQQKKFNSMVAMVIDDDEISSSYHVKILSRLGIQCMAVDDVEYGIWLLKESYRKGNGYDICFINWNMEQEAGILAIQKIREAFDRDTLILVSASNERSIHEKQMKGLGADYVLEKPIFQSTIYDLMTEICRDEVKKEENEKPDYDFSGKRILIVEDNAINAEVLMGYLRETNLECDWVRDGKKAIEQFIKAGSHSYDAILMDINMPVLDGYEAVREIRRCEEEQEEKIPIIAVTANTFSEDIVKVYDAGMNAYISKPINTKILFETIDTYLL